MVDPNYYLPVLIIIMLGCGVLGGLVNYWGESVLADEKHPLLRRLAAGIAAALVVPLFLNMISSTLLEVSREKPLGLFIFAGFCIIAAISSKAFIDSVTKRVLNRVEQVEKDQARRDKETEVVVAAQTEPAPPPVESESKGGRFTDFLNLDALRTRRGAFEVMAFGTDEDAKKVIHALGKPGYAWRYLKGLTSDTGLSEHRVGSKLDWLVANGLAAETSGVRGQLWGLTAKGRSAFAAIIQQPEIRDDKTPHVPESPSSESKAE